MTDVLFLYFTAFLLLPFVVSTFRKSFLLFYKSLLGQLATRQCNKKLILPVASRPYYSAQLHRKIVKFGRRGKPKHGVHIVFLILWKKNSSPFWELALLAIRQFDIYRIIAKITRRCTKCSIKFPHVIIKLFEKLLNRRVCFLHFSSSYIRVRVIFEFVVFTRLYGNTL